MFVSELLAKGEISVRSSNVCKDNGLKTVSDIIIHFRFHLGFKQLRRCGALTDKELVGIVHKYINEQPLSLGDTKTEQSQDTTLIHSFHEEGEIDARAFNTCRDNGILTLEDLRLYFHNHLTFKEFRNCGNKSSNQLIELLENYAFKDKDRIRFKKYLTSSHEFKDRALRFVTIITSGLSDKGRKILSQFLGPEVDSKLVLERILKGKLYQIHRHLPNTIETGLRTSTHDEILKYYHELDEGIDSLLNEQPLSLEYIRAEQDANLIQSFYDNSKIDVRAFNACQENEIHTLEELRLYFDNHLTFKGFRNCGDKTNNQLIELLDNHSINDKREIKQEKYLTSSHEFKDRALRFVTIITSGLSDKGLKILSQFLGPEVDSKLVLERILKSEFYQIHRHLPDADETGLGTIIHAEILKYYHELKEGIDSLLNEQPIEQDGLVSIIKGYNSGGSIQSRSIFQLTNTLIDKNKLFKTTPTIILKNAFHFYKNQPTLSITEIAEKANTYSAKVLKFKKTCFSKLRIKLEVLKSYENKLSSKYQVESEGDYIVIDERKSNEINSISETNFSKPFITYILSIFLSNNFVIKGVVSDALMPKLGSPRARHEWKNIYLLNKNLDGSFNYVAFIDDVDKRLAERIHETYSFNLLSYLSRFGAISNSVDDLKRITPFVELVLYEEFGLTIDLEDNIIFQRNTIKKVHEYAFEALTVIGKQSKVKTIFNKVKELHPAFDKDEKSIQSAMTKQTGFVAIGRKSTYGLKEWEETLDNFRGGTIRNIVKEFLETYETPMHLDDITTAVLKFRPKSNKSSISTNLQLDKSNTFKFFKGHFVGLKSLSYNEVEFSAKKINRAAQQTFSPTQHKSWDDRFKVFEDFVHSNDRLPVSRNCPESEKRLYHWFYRQKKILESGNLKKGAAEKIQQLAQQFPERYNGSNRKTEENFKLLHDFISTNQRVPKAHNEGEYRLYSFLYRTAKRFKDGKLSDEEIEQYNRFKHLIAQFPDSSGSNRKTEENFKLLYDFISTNQRVPKSLNEGEYKLYSFLYRTAQRFKKGKLSDEEIEQYNRVKHLISKFQ